MKKTILTAMTILAVFGLSACGNVQTADKEVSGVTTTTSASVVTTVTTTGTTTVGEVTTAPSSGDVSTSDTAVTTEPTETTTTIVTTSANETTTTTVATSKATTTTTKKATTTTKKATTTTAKKTTTTAPKKTEKVTTTTTAEKKVQLTQNDIDRLVKELQEYSNSKCDFDNLFYTEDEMWERIESETPEVSSWDGPIWYNIYENKYTYDYVLNQMKDEIDVTYEFWNPCHIVVYTRFYENGFEWEGRQYSHKPCYVMWCLR